MVLVVVFTLFSAKKRCYCVSGVCCLQIVSYYPMVVVYPYVRKNVFLAMMGVFCAVSGVSICELAIIFSRKDKGFCHCTAYVAVLCGTPFTTCRK